MSGLNRVCRNCKEAKPATIEHFYKVVDRRCGLSAQCKSCSRAKINALRNTPEGREKSRKAYTSDHAHALANAAHRRRDINGAVRAKRRVYGLEWRKTIFGRSNQLLSSARTRAATKSVPFDLTREWIVEKLTAGKCEATGIPFDLATGFLGPTGKKQGAPFGPSIDRKDPAKGYTADNCRMVVWAFNIAIGSWGEEIFLQIAAALVEKRSGDSA